MDLPEQQETSASKGGIFKGDNRIYITIVVAVIILSFSILVPQILVYRQNQKNEKKLQSCLSGAKEDYDRVVRGLSILGEHFRKGRDVFSGEDAQSYLASIEAQEVEKKKFEKAEEDCYRRFKN